MPPVRAYSMRMSLRLALDTGSTRFERLVEHQHARAVDHGGGQTDLLGHAGRIVDDHLVGGLLQVEGAQQVMGASDGLRTPHAPQHAGIHEQLQTGQPVEDLIRLRHNADRALGAVHVAPHVMAQDHGRAGVRHQQPGHHVQRGRLARPVGADQPIERADRDVQGTGR